jgi:hypothetical protein
MGLMWTTYRLIRDKETWPRRGEHAQNAKDGGLARMDSQHYGLAGTSEQTICVGRMPGWYKVCDVQLGRRFLLGQWHRLRRYGPISRQVNEHVGWSFIWRFELISGLPPKPKTKMSGCRVAGPRGWASKITSDELSCVKDVELVPQIAPSSLSTSPCLLASSDRAVLIGDYDHMLCSMDGNLTAQTIPRRSDELCVNRHSPP